MTFLGKKNYNQDEIEFNKFKNWFVDTSRKFYSNNSLNAWDYSIDTSTKNHNNFEIGFTKNGLLKLREIATSFKTKDIKDKTLKKYLELIDLDLKSDINQPNFPDHIHGDKIIHKYNKLCNKNSSNFTKLKPEDLIADEYIDLLKERNACAQHFGYKNYYDYALKNYYDTNENEISKISDELKAFIVQNPYIKRKIRHNNNFDIEFIEAMYLHDMDDVLNTSLNMYEKMGWKNLNKNIIFDLMPRKNKENDCYFTNINKHNDVRIFMNFDNDFYGFDTLNHELGHAVYDLGISKKLSFFEKHYPTSALTEGVAILMQKLPYKESTLANDLITHKPFAKEIYKHNQQMELSSCITTLVYNEFETELYLNPDQDLKKLWYRIINEFSGEPIPKHLDNSWVGNTIIQFIKSPGYTVNHLKGDLISEQLYEAASKKLGKLTENPKTAEYFKNNIFKFGNTLSESEIIKRVTGEELSAKALIKYLKSLL